MSAIDPEKALLLGAASAANALLQPYMVGAEQARVKTKRLNLHAKQICQFFVVIQFNLIGPVQRNHKRAVKVLSMFS